jgi:hypothetical protein
MSEESGFLLACLRGERATVPEGLDWDKLFELAKSHGVFPAFYREYAQTEAGAALPAKFAEHFREEWTNSLFLARELRELLDHSALRGIDLLPLKGPALAECLYGQATARSFHDLDILVREKDFPRAHALLLELGFAETGSANDYHRDYARNHTLVELHFAVAPPSALNFDIAAALRRARPIQYLGKPALFFSPPDLILYLSLHGIKHRFSKLVWVLDLARALEALSEADAAMLLEEATKQKLRKLLLTSCAIARHSFKIDLPKSLMRALEDQPYLAQRGAAMADQILLVMADPTTSPHDAVQYLHLTDSAADRWMQRLHFFAPTRQDYRWTSRYGVPGRYAVLVRPFRLLLKYGPAPVIRTLFCRASLDHE